MPGGNYNKVDFGHMEAEMNAIKSEHARFEQNAQELIRKASQYKATWDGPSREAWDTIEAEWNKHMAVMQEKLFKAHAFLAQSHERMTSDESQVASRVGA